MLLCFVPCRPASTGPTRKAASTTRGGCKAVTHANRCFGDVLVYLACRLIRLSRLSTPLSPDYPPLSSPPPLLFSSPAPRRDLHCQEEESLSKTFARRPTSALDALGKGQFEYEGVTSLPPRMHEWQVCCALINPSSLSPPLFSKKTAVSTLCAAWSSAEANGEAIETSY